MCVSQQMKNCKQEIFNYNQRLKAKERHTDTDYNVTMGADTMGAAQKLCRLYSQVAPKKLCHINVLKQ